MDRAVIRNIVAVIAQRRRKERHQPESINAELLQVIQFLSESAEIPDAVPRTVIERTDVNLIDDRVLVPERVLGQCQELISPANLAAAGFRSRGIFNLPHRALTVALRMYGWYALIEFEIVRVKSFPDSWGKVPLA